MFWSVGAIRLCMEQSHWSNFTIMNILLCEYNSSLLDKLMYNCCTFPIYTYIHVVVILITILYHTHSFRNILQVSLILKWRRTLVQIRYICCCHSFYHVLFPSSEVLSCSVNQACCVCVASGFSPASWAASVAQLVECQTRILEAWGLNPIRGSSVLCSQCCYWMSNYLFRVVCRWWELMSLHAYSPSYLSISNWCFLLQMCQTRLPFQAANALLYILVQLRMNRAPPQSCTYRMQEQNGMFCTPYSFLLLYLVTICSCTEHDLV